MDRTSSSIGTAVSNSKAVWLSKLACRREDRNDVDDALNRILSSNDSVEVAFPTSGSGKGMLNQNRSCSNQRNYSSIPSFPVCSIGCSKNKDETDCMELDTKTMLSKQLSILDSDQENSTDFDDGSIIDKNSRKKTKRFDNTERTTINCEVLSPTLKLLHEVHFKKWPSNTAVYFLPSSTHATSQDQTDDDPTEAKSEDSDPTSHEQNKGDSVQKERMLFRQQLRYEAIRKDLFDNVTHSSIDQCSLVEHSRVNFLRQDRNDDDSMTDTVGCQAVSFWNYLPSMSHLLLNVLPENEVMDDDSVYDRDIDEISFSAGTNEDRSLSSHESDTKSSCAEDEDDYYIPNRVNKQQESNARITNHEDPSCSGSFMDQSHIYLMMTSARQKRTISKKNQQQKESSSTNGNAIDAKKISELTIDDITVNSRIQTDYIEDELITSQNNDKHALKESILSDFGWVRHFQPFGNHPIDVDVRQRQWLNSIYLSFNERNDPVSDQRLERRVAAKEALHRIQRQRNQHRFANFSSISIDLWS